jgi:hypothetical protein
MSVVVAEAILAPLNWFKAFVVSVKLQAFDWSVVVCINVESKVEVASQAAPKVATLFNQSVCQEPVQPKFESRVWSEGEAQGVNTLPKAVVITNTDVHS